MEARLAKLEVDVEAQLEEMREMVIKTQQDTLKEISDMMQSFLIQVSKEKPTVDVTIPDLGKCPPSSILRNPSSSGTQPGHMQGRSLTQANPTTLVHPTVQKEKTISIFPDTLGEASRIYLIGHFSGSTDMVMTGEHVKTTLGDRGLYGRDTPKDEYKKEEHDVKRNAKVPRPQPVRGRDQNVQKKQGKKEKGNQSFTPLPLSYKDLYAQLHKDNVVRPYPSIPWNPPFPDWYNPNAHCEYHSDVPGHSIEDCPAFKKLVQGLIKKGVLQFGEPNVIVNRFPNHGSHGVDLMEIDSKGKGKSKV